MSAIFSLCFSFFLRQAFFQASVWLKFVSSAKNPFYGDNLKYHWGNDSQWHFENDLHVCHCMALNEWLSMNAEMDVCLIHGITSRTQNPSCLSACHVLCQAERHSCNYRNESFMFSVRGRGESMGYTCESWGHALTLHPKTRPLCVAYRSSFVWTDLLNRHRCNS